MLPQNPLSDSLITDCNKLPWSYKLHFSEHITAYTYGYLWPPRSTSPHWPQSLSRSHSHDYRLHTPGLSHHSPLYKHTQNFPSLWSMTVQHCGSFNKPLICVHVHGFCSLGLFPCCCFFMILPWPCIYWLWIAWPSVCLSQWLHCLWSVFWICLLSVIFNKSITHNYSLLPDTNWNPSL